MSNKSGETMKKNILLTLLLLTASCYALELVENQNEVNITQTGHQQIKYDVIFDSQDINATLEPITIPSQWTNTMTISYSKTFFTASGELEVNIITQDAKTDSAPLEVNMDVVSQDGNNTVANVQTNTAVTVNVYRAMEECFSQAIVEKSQLLIGGKEYFVEEIDFDSTTFKTGNDYQKVLEGEEITIPFSNKDVKLQIMEVFPAFDATRIKVIASECPEVQVIEDKDGDGVLDKDDECPDTPGNQSNGCPKPKTKMLIIERLEGESMKRGQRFYFKITENETNTPVGDVGVIFTNMDTGDVIGTSTTNNYGVGSVMVEENIESNRVLASVQKTGYEGSSKVYNFPITYGEYLKEKTLVIKGLPEEAMVETQLNATIQNKNKNLIDQTEISIYRDDEKLKTLQVEENNFNYTPSVYGTYRFQPEKTGYETESTVVNILKDTDGDGIPDEKDKCPDVKGSENNSGCPDQEPKFQILGEDGPINSHELIPDNEYTVRLLDETGEVINYDGPIKINGITNQMEAGQVKFTPEATGYYEFTVNKTSLFQETSETFKTKEEQGMDWTPLLLILGILIITGIALFYFRNRGSDGNGFSDGKFKIGGKPKPTAPLPPGSEYIG